MAHGLEVRSPLLDQDVFMLAARLPEAMKLRGREGKHLLKAVARRHLPPEIVDRPKSGFGVPLALWLRTDLKVLLEDTLLDGRMARRGLFRMETVERLVNDHLHGGKDRALMLWNLLVLEIWHREVLESRP
jgi:asparagine synthase (glutamine-hydrolysing)